MKKLKFLLLLLSFSALAFAFRAAPANDNIFLTVAFKLYEFYAKYPQEKIYLHQDKTLYSLGETIWFKAYLTIAPTANADTLSKILYVDLVSPANKVVISRKLRTEGGTANGDIFLPDTLSEGTYELRAYTNWMRNFSSDYFFRQDVNIVNPSETAVKAGITFRTIPHSTGDSVVSSLLFYQLPFSPLPRLKLNLQLVIDGKKQKKHTLETDANGQVAYAVNLPKTKKDISQTAYLLVDAASETNKFAKTYQLPESGSDLDLQFFPESGTWLTDMETRLAFKAINRSGKGTAVEGGIYDQLGTKVADFKSEHLGMGQLLFKPEKDKVYEARVKRQDGTELVFPIAAAREKGVTLSLTRTDKHIKLKLINNRTSQPDSLFVIAHAQGKIFYAAKANPSLPEVIANLPFSVFPAGLVYFTIFNRAGYPLCERVAFVNLPAKLNIAVTTDKQVYGQRERVNMLVSVTDATGNPVAGGDFSLAVKDSRNATESDGLRDNIYTHTYLSSELKGHIEQPGYYFDAQNPNAIHHLDLLLLTQGWRRFSWPDVMQDKQPAITFMPEKYMSISGMVEKEFGRNKDAGTTNLTIISSSGSGSKRTKPDITLAPTAEDGSFYLSELNHYDTLNIFMQARTAKGGKNLLIKRNVFAAPELAFTPAEDVSAFRMLNEAYLRSISNWSKSDKAFRLASGAIMLGEVEVKADKLQPDTRRLHSVHFTDAVIKVGEDKVVRGSILEYLWGIAGVQVSGSGMNATVSIRGGGTPAFILDGMNVDLEFIQSLPPTEVETIELLKGANAAVYPNASNGAIVIFTKRGNPNYDYADEPVSGAISFKLPGYYNAREFYVPRYDVPDDRHNLPDFRNTLHWQPSLITDAAGKATISFYTSDDVTSFSASCEGFTGLGAVGTGSHDFKVALKR